MPTDLEDDEFLCEVVAIEVGHGGTYHTLRVSLHKCCLGLVGLPMHVKLYASTHARQCDFNGWQGGLPSPAVACCTFACSRPVCMAPVHKIIMS